MAPVTKRVSARHQVNGRIGLEAASLRRDGPAEETSFLRSVQIRCSVCSFTEARLPKVRFGPDVFADALVLFGQGPAPGVPLKIPLSEIRARHSSPAWDPWIVRARALAHDGYGSVKGNGKPPLAGFGNASGIRDLLRRSAFSARPVQLPFSTMLKLPFKLERSSSVHKPANGTGTSGSGRGPRSDDEPPP
jgi:hypothetical protein